jgi:hypothetical protein
MHNLYSLITKMTIQTLKQKVILWRYNKWNNYANKLEKAIKIYEKWLLTKPRLDNYYRQLEVLVFKN